MSAPEPRPSAAGAQGPFAGLYRRILRRESHSPRSTLAIVLAVILTLACAWAGTEAVLAMAHAHPLLVGPDAARRALVDLGRDTPGAVLGGGVVLALIGLLLLIAALASGRRARHTVPGGRAAAIVDNEVIASSLARDAAYAGNIDPDATSVAVGHRSAVVTVRPVSGQQVDVAAVRDAVDRRLASFSAVPRLRARVRVSEQGRVGE